MAWYDWLIAWKRKEPVKPLYQHEPRKMEIFERSKKFGSAMMSKVMQHELEKYWRTTLFMDHLNAAVRQVPPNPELLGKSLGMIYYVLEHHQDFAINHLEDFGRIIAVLKKAPGIDLSELREKIDRFDGRRATREAVEVVNFQRQLLGRL